MTVDPAVVTAIMALFGMGVIGIVQTLKRILHVEGIGAIILTVVVSFAATAIYLLQAQMFSVLALIVYGFIVFGEASGLYHVFSRTKTDY